MRLYEEQELIHSSEITKRRLGINDSLTHHGILGQKWGIRRFQDANGRLTEAGRKRYYENYDEGKLNKRGERAYNKNADLRKEHQEADEARRRARVEKAATYIREHLKSDDVADYRDVKKNGENSKDYSKYEKDCKFGLKALEKYYKPYAIVEKNYEPSKEDMRWFAFEDQTLGMPTVARMINNGKTSHDVKELIKSVEDIRYSYDDEMTKGINKRFINEISEGNMGGRLIKYADACEEVKRGEKSK